MSAISARRARLAAADGGASNGSQHGADSSTSIGGIAARVATQELAGNEAGANLSGVVQSRTLRSHNHKNGSAQAAASVDRAIAGAEAPEASTSHKRLKVSSDNPKDATLRGSLGNSNLEEQGSRSSSADAPVQNIRNDAGVAAPALAYCSSIPTLLKGENKADASNGIVCALRCAETIALVGTYSVTVLAGRILISGCHLDARHSKMHVFAPRSQGLPVIRSSPDELESNNESDLQMPSGGYGAVILIEDLDSTNIEELGQACHLVRPDAFTFQNPVEDIDWPLRFSRPVLKPTKGIFAVTPLPSWLEALDRISQQRATYLVRGPKRTGKSTFARMLLSRLQTSIKQRVCYLETDLGQPEFGPPGTVALHVLESSILSDNQSHHHIIGPSWACFRNPARVHFIGDTSPRNDPRGYMAAIADLLALYTSEYASEGSPLVINTQGWIKGMGADLLAEIEQLARPDYIFAMQGEQDIAQGTYDPDWPMQSGTLEHLTLLEGASASVTRERAMNASDARALALTSYFYSTRFPKFAGGDGMSAAQLPAWDFSEALVAQAPFVVDLAEGLQGGIHVSNASAALAPELQLMALNASIVALVLTAQDEVPVDRPRRKSEIWARALRKARPDPSRSVCLGLAIVRSIDVEAGEVHLLTPVSSDSVTIGIEAFRRHRPNSEPVLALVKGAVEVPVWLSMDYDLLRSNASFGGGALWNAGNAPSTLAGVPLHAVPYLDFSDDTSYEGSADGMATDANATGANALSLSKRRIRRNLLRPSQHRS